jgi:hypothetical protein
LSHSSSPFVWFFFWDSVSWIICLDWLWITVLLIFASWVARIMDVNHQCQALPLPLMAHSNVTSSTLQILCFSHPLLHHC